MNFDEEQLFHQLADVTGIPAEDRVSRLPESTVLERERLVRQVIEGGRAQRKLDEARARELAAEEDDVTVVDYSEPASWRHPRARWFEL